jgi:hypothetical protein
MNNVSRYVLTRPYRDIIFHAHDAHVATMHTSHDSDYKYEWIQLLLLYPYDACLSQAYTTNLTFVPRETNLIFARDYNINIEHLSLR